MELEHTPPATKRARRPSPSQAAGDGEDRLSALDDATLHAILARLPLRDAAAMAALSRRWPRVLATLPHLLLRPTTFNRREFPDNQGDEDYCQDAKRWMDALGRVLGGHAVPVAAFEVRARFMGLYAERFGGVFRALCGSGGLLELVVSNTKHAECCALPSPVYSCRTLTSLELYNCRLRVLRRLTGLRAVRSLRLHNVAATDANLRRVISRCGAMEHQEIKRVHRARNIVVRAPRLEKLDIHSHRPVRVSVKKAPRLDTVRLSLCYGKPEFSWRAEDTMDTDGEYSFSEIDERRNFDKMAEREHKETDEVRNMVTFLGGIGSAKVLRLHLSQ